MKEENEDPFWQKVVFPPEPDAALTRSELAARISAPLSYVQRNVPAGLFIGGRIHWHEYCMWRMKEQERRANEADGLRADRHLI
jgi:hypothetical protein